jgi:hypothetical protein
MIYNCGRGPHKTNLRAAGWILTVWTKFGGARYETWPGYRLWTMTAVFEFLQSLHMHFGVAFYIYLAHENPLPDPYSLAIISPSLVFRNRRIQRHGLSIPEKIAQDDLFLCAVYFCAVPLTSCCNKLWYDRVVLLEGLMSWLSRLNTWNL